ncbi:hypothetical protein BaRGS_00007725 [Batillaria attramentaria]|uniref:Uncharacterized protein n=1 Tax=Batillaria attramentaria TaxID=370345 RepID=A0ABD0LN28_9CAEN
MRAIREEDGEERETRPLLLRKGGETCPLFLLVSRPKLVCLSREPKRKFILFAECLAMRRQSVGVIREPCRLPGMDGFVLRQRQLQKDKALLKLLTRRIGP